MNNDDSSDDGDQEGDGCAIKGEGEAAVCPQQVVVGETGTWVITYTVGPSGIAVGGGLRVFFDVRDIPYLVTSPRADQNASFPCTRPYGRCTREDFFAPWHASQPRSTCPQLLTASASDGSKLELSAGCLKVTESLQLAADYEPAVNDYGYYCDIIVREAPLFEGDAIRLVFGDEERGLPGFRAPIYASDAFRLWVMVDSQGDGAYHFIASPCVVRVTPGPAASLNLRLPSTAVIGEIFEATLSALDRYDNISNAYEGMVMLEAPEGTKGLPSRYTFTPDDEGQHTFSDVSLSEEGLHRISARDRALPLIAGRSNPVKCCAQGPLLRVYWGDLHGHTVLSDGGERTPEDYYSYGRDVAGLDFCALTDHGWCVRDGGEAKVRQAAIEFDDAGRFVTLFGYECTHMRGEGNVRCGHRNVYHLEVDNPVYNTDKYFLRRCTRDFETVQQLWKALEGTDALIIPHGGTNWDLHHRGMERLVEMRSKWGSREYYGCENPDPTVYPDGAVQDALARGYRMGFVGGSDTHCARPGDKGPGVLCYPSGLTAVCAEELTREAIWDGLWNRRTYATTGEKILLSFSMDGHVMGEEYVANGDPTVSVEVVGTGDIEAIELIKDGTVIHTRTGTGMQDAFELQVDGPAGASSYYYVRVRQRDAARAWASPIWVRKEV